MAGILTLSSKLVPFPYASAAISLYTAKAELVYDEAAKELLLDLDGSKLTTEEEIVQALAKAGGLSDDNEKVAIQ
jgi:glutamyl-tRNA synthetase